MFKGKIGLSKSAPHESQKRGMKLVAGIIVLIAIVAIAWTMVAPKNSSTNAAKGGPEDFGVSRQKYFEEAFVPDRESYDLFEKAAAYTKKPISEMPAFFNLKNEEEIFSALPQIPKDFSETSYLLASGKYFSIGFLEKEYYSQPEFYPNFKEGGLRFWAKPDPTSWGVNGYGTYPAEQNDTLKLGKRENFVAAVFLYAGYGVQTYQGVTLEQDSASKKYFDVSISPKDFLLDPTFPKFGSNWAEKIIITGRIKPGTPKGDYVIGINIETPPKELKAKWEFEHKNLYYDAASGIGPSGNQIQLNIRVE